MIYLFKRSYVIIHILVNWFVWIVLSSFGGFFGLLLKLNIYFNAAVLNTVNMMFYDVIYLYKFNGCQPSGDCEILHPL